MKIFQAGFKKYFLINALLFTFFACVTTVESEVSEAVDLEDSAFETFLYEQLDQRIINDPRFQKILEMHHRVSENRLSAQKIVGQINALKDELDILMAECPYPEKPGAYIFSIALVEPVNIAYYQKSIYRCEHYVNDSEIAMANSRNNLDYLGQVYRELERILNNVIGQCEMKGMADEHRYMLIKGIEPYLIQVNSRDALYKKWIDDLEKFAKDYAGCMSNNNLN
ncbi:MAG: hypothetical protein JXR70_08905 [Spirochaetales bacterium]|nr:hypothetical protein [Spirochaetales bacterium]